MCAVWMELGDLRASDRQIDSGRRRQTGTAQGKVTVSPCLLDAVQYGGTAVLFVNVASTPILGNSASRARR